MGGDRDRELKSLECGEIMVANREEEWEQAPTCYGWTKSFCEIAKSFKKY